MVTKHKKKVSTEEKQLQNKNRTHTTVRQLMVPRGEVYRPGSLATQIVFTTTSTYRFLAARADNIDHPRSLVLAAADRAQPVEVIKRAPSARRVPAAPRHDIHHALLSVPTENEQKMQGKCSRERGIDILIFFFGNNDQ